MILWSALLFSQFIVTAYSQETAAERERHSKELQTNTLNATQGSKPNSSDWDEKLDDINQRKVDADVVLILLDCSQSMSDLLAIKTTELKGKTKSSPPQKMDVAKDAIKHIAQSVPPSTYLGLRTYGMGYSSDPFIDCKQSTLLIPPAQANRKDFFSQMREIRPFGLTPLEFALRQASENDLRSFAKQKTIILISDGADTCGGNPCEFIKQLPRMGINLKVYCIGLGLKHKPDDILARNQLNCIAIETDGAYLDASSASQIPPWLSEVLQEALGTKSELPSEPSSKP